MKNGDGKREETKTVLSSQQLDLNVLSTARGHPRTRLTPSLPPPVRFPGWKTHGRACKQYGFRSCYTSTFNAVRFDKKKKSFYLPVQKEKEAEGFKKKFALLVVVFHVT